MTYQEILAKCDAERFHSSTRQLLTCIAIDIADLSRKYPRLDQEFAAIGCSMESLGTLMDTPNCPSPDNFLDLMGFGHFKECYSFSPSLVIKFCAERNPTAEEEKALEDAYRNDMEFLFLPTFYYELPHCLSSENLEKDDEDDEIYDEDKGWIPNPEWGDNTLITHACLQLAAETADYHYFNEYDSCFNKLSECECNVSTKMWHKTRDFIGLPVDTEAEDFQGLANICMLWARDVFNLYGLDALKRFSDFCQEYHIWDLHSSNVGYALSGGDELSIPVIMDWMSR